jgi:hypothetical protein
VTGRWEIYCSNARAISLDELASKLSRQEHRREGEKLIVVARDTPSSPPAEIEVTIERGPAVGEYAEDLAQRDLPLDPGVPEPDRDALRASDVRYLLDYDADRHYALVNALITTAGAIEQACGGIIYDATSDRFA